MADKVLIDIPYPEDCEHCLIGSLVPEYARSAKWLHYTTYCKVTGECVAGKERGDNCPLHKCKTGRNNDVLWDALSEVYNMSGLPDKVYEIVGDVMLGLYEEEA